MVTCIIPTKYRYEDLIESIESIYNQSGLGEFEIIVLDSNEDIAISKKIRNYCDKKTEIKYYKDNFKSPCHARNFAAKMSSFQYLALLDDDIVLEPNYIITAIKFIKLEEIDGVNGITTNSVFNKIAPLFYWGDFTDNRIKNIKKPIQTQYLSSGNCVIKKVIFNDYMFDEFYRGYSFAEDIDFSYRASKKFKFMIHPNIRMIHKSSPVGRISKEDYHKLKLIGLSYFYFKNIYPKQKVHFLIRMLPIVLSNNFVEDLKLLKSFFLITESRLEYIKKLYLNIKQ